MKVLILSCSTGGGHNSCANYIKEELTLNNIECNFIDFFDIFGKNAKKMSSDIYLKTLGNNVYAIESGIVIFKGNKDGYNDTVIIQTSNGYDMWYSNLKNINVNIYDYVNKNDLISESNDKLYLVINKDNKFYTYKEYLSEKN